MELSSSLSTTFTTFESHLLQFIQYLDEEKQFLIKNDLRGLEASLSTKQTIIDVLQRFFIEWESAMQSSTPLNDTSILKLIAENPKSTQSELKKHWKRIKELLKTCDQKNLVNGIMITTMKNYNNTLMQLLTQRQTDNVYSSNPNKELDSVSTREHKV